MVPLMTPERWQEVKQLFQSVVEFDSGRRNELLAVACGGDNMLRKEVEALLASDEQAADFIEQSAFDVAARVLADRDAESALGRCVGPYKITREVSRGGMGVVYEAARADDQYQQRVAVKLIKRGVDTEDVLRRFRHERQILANLDHPNIARLLDAGTTEDGLPYFVMEYVEGEPIGEYCDRQRLPTTERLKLFRMVCSAVQYAHQNLVIHRDIKPGNILVTADGVSKLLDFGIAKLIGPELLSLTENLTVTAPQLMTPEYASPEQIRGEPISTATDIYSLGVVLYDLLTGHRPYHLKSRLRQDIAQTICEIEPEKPSIAISRSRELPGTRNGKRATLTPAVVCQTPAGDPKRLRRRLAGDLDNIVLMALRKEPSRRYASVESFSEDIHRHLVGLPVIAQKGTFSYRTGKFIQRNKLGVTAAGLIVIALTIGIAATLWQAHVAKIERTKAERRFNDVRKLSHAFLFEFHDAIKDLPGSTPARQLLVKEALEYLDGLAQEAGDSPSLQLELAAAYIKVGDVQGKPYTANIGDTEGAVKSYGKALAIHVALLAKDGENIQGRSGLALSHERIGFILQRSGNQADALAHLRESLAIREAICRADPANQHIRFELAINYYLFGDAMAYNDWHESLELYRKSEALLENLATTDPTNRQARLELAISQARIGYALERIGVLSERIVGGSFGADDRYRQSLESFRKSLATREALLKADPINAVYRRMVADCEQKVGDLLARLGNEKQVLPIYSTSLSTFEALSAADPSNAEARHDLSSAYERLGDILTMIGNADAGLENYRKAIDINEELCAADPTNTEGRLDLVNLRERMGKAYEKNGRAEPAVTSYSKSLVIRDSLGVAYKSSPEVRADFVQTLNRLAALLIKTGRIQEASQLTIRALETLKPLAQGNQAHPTDLNVYAWVLLTCQPVELRDPFTALNYAKRSAEITNWKNPVTLNTLAIAYHLTGDSANAIETAKKALALVPLSIDGREELILRRDINIDLSKYGLVARSQN